MHNQKNLVQHLNSSMLSKTYGLPDFIYCILARYVVHSLYRNNCEFSARSSWYFALSNDPKLKLSLILLSLPDFSGTQILSLSSPLTLFSYNMSSMATFHLFHGLMTKILPHALFLPILIIKPIQINFVYDYLSDVEFTTMSKFSVTNKFLQMFMLRECQF